MTDSPSPDLVNTGLLLYLPYRAMEARVFEELTGAGYSDITLAQARIFQRIGPHGIRATDLAEQARVTKQTAGALLHALEQSGYVRREIDPMDARARLVHISERGLAAAEVAARAVEAVESEWAAFLGKGRYRRLRETLLSLREITDPYR